MAQTADKSSPPCTGSFLSRQISVSAAHLLFWPVFFIGFASDLWTKSLVFNWLSSSYPPRFPIIDGFFQLVLVENRGAAWGIASDRTIPLIIVSIIALLIVFSVFLFMKNRPAVVIFSLSLFAAGICGNLYDRLFNAGRVRDFLDFYYSDVHFPAFNVADSMLTVAVFLLILVTLFSSKPQEV
ncbi:MAG: signal peptidase II [Sedimentisphaerales bacterium]